MSSESKKKRGSAGVTNALTNAWRGNGRPQDWMARRMGATRGQRSPSSGSMLMRGLVGGFVAASLGLGKPYGNYELAFEHAQLRVTHPLLRL